MLARKTMASTAFRDSFKFYKKRQPPPDLSKVIDLRHGIDQVPKKYEINEHALCLKNVNKPFGVSDNLKLFSVAHLPGFLIIPNALTEAGQHYWMLRGLKELPNLPHKCNLDIHLSEPRTTESNIFDDSVDQFMKSTKTKPELYALPIYKLRWVTLGYHYDYNTKTYCDDNFTPFPPDLGALSQYFASIIGYGDNYKAEAAIVNYYHLDSTLSGHTDHSEDDLEAPLLSLSFGNDAVFLLGGETLDIEPTPIYLRSGDLVVLWKDARLAYHGVPRICDETSLAPISTLGLDSHDKDLPPLIKWALNESENAKKSPVKALAFDYKTPKHLKFDGSRSFYDHYLKFTRININIRQVKIKTNEV